MNFILIKNYIISYIRNILKLLAISPLTITKDFINLNLTEYQI